MRRSSASYVASLGPSPQEQQALTPGALPDQTPAAGDEVEGEGSDAGSMASAPAEEGPVQTPGDADVESDASSVTSDAGVTRARAETAVTAVNRARRRSSRAFIDRDDGTTLARGGRSQSQYGLAKVQEQKGGAAPEPPSRGASHGAAQSPAEGRAGGGHGAVKEALQKGMSRTKLVRGRFERQRQLDALKATAAFRRLCEAERAALFDRMQLRRFAQGDVLMVQGTEGEDFMDFVLEGSLEVRLAPAAAEPQLRELASAAQAPLTVNDPEVKRLVGRAVKVCFRGDYVGESGLVSAASRGASIVASGRVVHTLRLRRAGFIALLEEHANAPLGDALQAMVRRSRVRCEEVERALHRVAGGQKAPQTPQVAHGADGDGGSGPVAAVGGGGSGGDDSGGEGGQIRSLSSRYRQSLEVDALRAGQLFAGLPTSELSLLVERCARRVCKAGDVIMEEGDEQSDFMVFITAGAASVTVTGAGGERRQVKTVSKGDYVGESGLVLSAPRNASVHASGHCEMLVLDKDAFSDLLGREAAAPGLTAALRQLLRKVQSKPVAQRGARPAGTSASGASDAELQQLRNRVAELESELAASQGVAEAAKARAGEVAAARDAAAAEAGEGRAAQAKAEQALRDQEQRAEGEMEALRAELEQERGRRAEEEAARRRDADAAAVEASGLRQRLAEAEARCRAADEAGRQRVAATYATAGAQRCAAALRSVRRRRVQSAWAHWRVLAAGQEADARDAAHAAEMRDAEAVAWQWKEAADASSRRAQKAEQEAEDTRTLLTETEERLRTLTAETSQLRLAKEEAEDRGAWLLLARKMGALPSHPFPLHLAQSTPARCSTRRSWRRRKRG